MHEEEPGEIWRIWAAVRAERGRLRLGLGKAREFVVKRSASAGVRSWENIVEMMCFFGEEMEDGVEVVCGFLRI